MKIAIICDVLGKPNNGTSIATYNLIAHLKKKGHEVHVICPDKEKEGEEGYHILPLWNVGPLNGYVRKNGVAIGSPKKEIMEPIIKEMDIIHTELPFMVSAKAVRIAKKHNVAISCSNHAQAENCTSHFWLMHFEPANYFTYRLFYNKIYKHAVSVHYPSEFIRDYLLARGYTRPKPYVITNGVNPGIYPMPCEKPEELKDKFVILYTARLVKEKSQKLLIDAIKYSKYKDKIKVIFAGSGPRLKKLQTRAHKKNLDESISFSFFTREEMNRVINYSDLYVHPSNIEIEAIAANEAVSCGLVPVISNSKKSAAPKFALDEHNLFAANSPKDLARKIDFWIENPELKALQKKEYLKRRTPLSVEQAMEEMEKMLLESIETHKQRKQESEKHGKENKRT